MQEDKLDAEFTAVEQLLSSGALNPLSVEASAKPQVLIRCTVNRFRSLHPKDERGIFLPSKPGGLDVVVTAKSLNRALQVMSRLMDVLVSRGFSIQTGASGPTVCVDGQQVRFGTGETIHRDVTRKPRVPQPKETWDYERIVAYEATEALALIIYSETWHSHGLQRRWADSKHQKVEDLVPDLVAGLMRTAIVLRREEEERKKRELERQQRVQEMIKLREQVEAEEKKVKQFDHCIGSW